MYEGEKGDGWRDYVLYGGIPLVLTFTTPDQKSDFLLNPDRRPDYICEYSLLRVGKTFVKY